MHIARNRIRLLTIQPFSHVVSYAGENTSYFAKQYAFVF